MLLLTEREVHTGNYYMTMWNTVSRTPNSEIWFVVPWVSIFLYLDRSAFPCQFSPQTLRFMWLSYNKALIYWLLGQCWKIFWIFQHRPRNRLISACYYIAMFYSVRTSELHSEYFLALTVQSFNRCLVFVLTFKAFGLVYLPK